jgi:Gram-negative bacterial TonB protein C-terminal
MPSLRPFLLAFIALFFFSISALPQPKMAPVPSDPFELVTGATKVPSTPEERAAVLNLLERARQNADLHAAGSAPFSLHVSFNASGNVAYKGSGDMEESWFAPFSFRWTAHLGNFSLDRISNGQRVFDDQQPQFIPIRLQMLRGAIFWPINFQQAHTLIRTASANWKGKELTCVLVSGEGSAATPTPGRRWVEREFCIEPKSGLLQVLSDAPGIYVLYDYSSPLRFHGRELARQFSVIEGGNQVLEARIESIGDPTSTAESLAPSEQMKTHGPGPLLGGTIRFPRIVPLPPGAAFIQPVIIHAVLDRTGKVGEAEIVENSGAELSQSALDIVRRSAFPQQARQAWPGHQIEAFINVQFVSQ